MVLSSPAVSNSLAEGDTVSGLTAAGIIGAIAGAGTTFLEGCGRAWGGYETSLRTCARRVDESLRKCVSSLSFSGGGASRTCEPSRRFDDLTLAAGVALRGGGSVAAGWFGDLTSGEV